MKQADPGQDSPGPRNRADNSPRKSLPGRPGIESPPGHWRRLGQRLGQRYRRLNITVRVTLFYTSAMLVLLVLLLVALQIIASYGIASSSQPTVQRIVQDTFDHLIFEDDQIEIDTDLDLFKEDVTLVIYGPDGKRLLGSTPPGFPVTTPLLNEQHQVVSGSAGQRWDIYDQRVDYYNSGVWVRGIYSLSGTTNFWQTVIRLALVILPIFVLLAGLLGYWITRQALQPVAQINQAVRSITASQDLTRRIRLPGSGRDEIYTLAANFDAMFERLEQTFRQLKQFTADASHELRTPLAAILAQAEQAALPASSPADIEQALASIRRQASGMASMLNQLLELARADHGQIQLQYERLNLTELCQMVLETLQDQESASPMPMQQESRLADQVWIEADETLLIRLLINLLTNAMRYGRAGGYVRLDLTRTADTAVLTVTDHGPGIAAADISHIFDRFYRSQKDRNKAELAGQGEGTGLGLAMVLWIVCAHHGVITVRSGSAFWSSTAMTDQRFPAGTDSRLADDTAAMPDHNSTLTGSQFTVYLPLLPGSA